MELDPDTIILVGVVALVVYSISLHELSHAYVATFFGDPTPGRHGRLTFNPLVQLDPFYSVLMPIMSYLMMGFPMGWAFCPIDPSRFRRPLRDNALTALAGPLMNFMLASFFIGLLWIPGLAPYDRIHEPSFNFQIFSWTALWNLALGVFNLLPLPGLDGYDVARPLLPLRIRRPLDNFRRMGFLPVFVAMALGPRILTSIWIPVFQFYDRLLPMPK